MSQGRTAHSPAAHAAGNSAGDERAASGAPAVTAAPGPTTTGATTVGTTTVGITTVGTKATGTTAVGTKATGATAVGAKAAGTKATGAVGQGTAPDIDATRLRVAIGRLYRRLRRHELAGLTPTQLSALSTVEKAGPLRLGDLAAAEGIAPSTLTRLATALEEGGYVRRYAVPEDARASTLRITPAGRAVLERIRQETTMALAGMLLDLTPDQRAAIAAALPAVEQLAGPDPREPQT